MKKISAFLCLFGFAISLHAASAHSAFKSVGEERLRQLELEKGLDSLARASEEYKKSMSLFARERSELSRFGIEIAASSDPESAQSILKNSRDEFEANIDGIECIGKIIFQDYNNEERMFLCQNSQDGSQGDSTLEFEYSWVMTDYKVGNKPAHISVKNLKVFLKDEVINNYNLY